MSPPDRSPDPAPPGARQDAAPPPAAQPAPAAPQIVVTAGNPTDAELAAVTVVLAAGHAEEQPAPTTPSRWLRAARLEGCGHPPISGPDGFPR